jgi:acetyltransferase-like isoleucine patch superfamily enzyme
MMSGDLLSTLVRKLTGRSYANLSFSQLRYAWQKGGMNYLRGCVWGLLRLRGSRGLMLGRAVRFISPGSLSYGRGVSFGDGCYLDCSADRGVGIGDRVTLREYGWLQCRSGFNAPTGRVSIEDDVYIGPFAVLGAGGDLVIGARTQIGARFTLSAESHARGANGAFVGAGVRRNGIVIGRECWIGNNVCILDGVRIGDRAVIGAGSVVTRDVPAGATAYGVPARVRATT